MEHQDFSIPLGGQYETRRDFSDKAKTLVATTVADRANIPLRDFKVALTGKWDPPREANPEFKDFEGRVDIDRVVDPYFGPEWRGEISITGSGQYGEVPCEAFRGQIHVFVVE